MSPRVPRVASLACAALVPVALGWIPLERAWGYTLWRALPPLASVPLALGLLALCLPAARRRVAATARRGFAFGAAQPGLLRAAPPALALGFWLLRERRLHGDSNILLFTAGSRTRFLFPDVGASWLFHAARRSAEALDVEGLVTTQILVSLCGAAAVVCVFGLAARLAPGPGRAAFAAGVVLCGGLLRVLAGHVEVYAFVTLAGAAYLWAGCAHLQGRCGLAPPALALGAGLWLHASFAVLVPSLLWLAWRGERRLSRSVMALALAAAPLLLFLAAMGATGATEELREAAFAAMRIAGLRESPQVQSYWLRLPGAAPGPGTEWVLLSAPHLRYLANAFFLLAPASLPVLLATGLAAPRRLVATPEARFLCVACLGTALYALLLRPVWGPWDWDLFSLTALCVGALAARVLVTALDDAELADVGPLLLGAALLLVAIPLLVAGVAPLRPVSPFATEAIPQEAGEPAWRAIERHLEPWL